MLSTVYGFEFMTLFWEEPNLYVQSAVLKFAENIYDIDISYDDVSVQTVSHSRALILALLICLHFSTDWCTGCIAAVKKVPEGIYSQDKE